MSGKEVGSFEFRRSSKDGPKSIKFTKDERFCGRQANKKTIQIFEQGNFSQPKYRVVAGPQLNSKKSTD